MTARLLNPATALVGITAGGTFIASGLGMLVCAGIGAIGDGRAIAALAVPGAATLALGAAMVAMARRAPDAVAIRPAVGFGAVTLAWLFAAIVGAVPLLAAGTFSSPLDAFFEAMSGFTTSGATLLGEIEPEPNAILMWRQMMQWLGGIGIVVLVVAIAPVSMLGVQRAFYAETSGITAERLTPRIVDTAKILAGIYIALTIACGIGYVITGMDAFDAVAHAQSTVATAGYSPKTASIGHFDSVGIELVAIAFMVAGGVNFAFYWRAIRGRPLMPPLAEVGIYLAILAAAIAVVTVSVVISDDAGDVGDSLRVSAFSVVTVGTTTGFVTADFDAFNHFSRVLLLVLMVIGACAGSTAGGLKVIRAFLLAESGGQEVRRQLEPRMVQVLRLGGRTFSEETRRAVFGYFLVYVLVLITGILALGASGLDPVTAISGGISNLNLIGPALGDIGAHENYEAFSPFARLVGATLMLIGRLEIFTVVAVLAAVFRAARG